VRNTKSKVLFLSRLWPFLECDLLPRGVSSVLIYDTELAFGRFHDSSANVDVPRRVCFLMG